MLQAISDRTDTQAGPPAVKLNDLADQINDHYREAESAARSTIKHVVAGGRLLMEVKARVGHGQFGQWLADNFRGSASTARAYMRVARNWPELESKLQTTGDLTIESALRLLSTPEGRPWDRPNSDFGLPDDIDGRPHRGIAKANGAHIVVELVPSTKFPGYIYSGIFAKDAQHHYAGQHHSRPVKSSHIGWLLDFILREEFQVDVATLVWDEGRFECSILFDAVFADFDPAKADAYDLKMARDLGYVA